MEKEGLASSNKGSEKGSNSPHSKGSKSQTSSPGKQNSRKDLEETHEECKIVERDPEIAKPAENTMESVLEQNNEESKIQASAESPEEDHPLTDKWTFWYVYDMSHEERKRKKGKARWQKEYKLNEVFTFGNLEDFWRLFNNVYNISDLVANTDFLLFKEGIRPEWEDPKNNDGGKWVVTLPIQNKMEKECEYAWMHIIYMMIGANIDKELYEIINGVIFSIRDKHLRLSVWLSDNSEPSLLKRVGDKVREVSKIPTEYALGYQVHKKAIQHNLDNESFLKA
jgi:translation initiation factor 4E